jgi:ABC-type branched-subunit amino acid transport system substrate-binding protein
MSSRSSFLASATATAAALALPLPSFGAPAIPSLSQLRTLLGIDPAYAGKGLTIDCGLVYPLTGAGAIFGSKLMDLPHLAVKHIAQLGGPTFNLVVKDNKSGDPDASVEATRELGAQHVGMELTSYAAGLGAQLPGIKKFKLFSLDGSGGTANFATGKPYFWGTIARTPTDAIPGIVKYLQKKMPEVKKVAFCTWDLGPLTDVGALAIADQFTQIGVEIVADERAPISATDFSTNIAKIKEAEPDVVFIVMYAEDPGYFMKQYALSGIGKPVFAFTDSLAARQIAGKAYDGLYVAFDYFDADHPQNPWARFYVSEFEKMEPGYKPDFYSANAYEDFFTLWDCIRRVIKTGGNPHDGAQLDAAFRAKPTFKSLYGGSDVAAGIGRLNLTTHSIASRPMRILQYTDGALNTLAYFEIGGKNFRLA